MNSIPPKKSYNSAKAIAGFALQGAVHPEFSLNETLADIFRASVKAHGKRIAIVENELRLTYAEADKRSDQIAAELIKRGAGPGKVVRSAPSSDRGDFDDDHSTGQSS